MDGELNSSFLKAGDKTRSNLNHERIAFKNMTDLDETVIHETIAKKQNALKSLKVIFEERSSSFSDLIYQNMKWFDTKNWEDDVAYGSNLDLPPASRILLRRPILIVVLCTKSGTNWRILQSHHNGLDAHSLWEKVFIYRRNEFKNVCLMAEIVFSLSVSNSMVERAFSLLTNDFRWSTKPLGACWKLIWVIKSGQKRRRMKFLKDQLMFT